MKAQTGLPDDKAPGGRWLAFGIFCLANRHPLFYRALGAVFRTWPALSHLVPIASRRRAVLKALERPRSLSNTSHASTLVAGEFMIGRDHDAEYAQDKALFDTLLARLDVSPGASATARSLATRIAADVGAAKSFDLVEDYLLWVVFRGIEPALGDTTALIGRGAPPDEADERQYLQEVRYVAGHLLGGDMAPIWRQRRAELCAAALRARVDAAMPRLVQTLEGARGCPRHVVQRNAVGLAWVSHPVTVQSAALMIQELLARPRVYAELRRQALVRDEARWTDAAWHESLRAHVLELMRFRPVFPVLSRDVPRSTAFDAGGSAHPTLSAGSSLGILSISALFDSRGVADIGDFCPARNWGAAAPARYLMFGHGERQCPAKDHAVTMLCWALIGFLTLPRMTWADPWGRRIRYDGPLIARMRLRPA